MSFHGGFLGVAIALLGFARVNRIPFSRLTDMVAPATPIGLMFGRIANFINGELWGRATDLPWGVIFPAGGPVVRHPSQIYEALLEGWKHDIRNVWWVVDYNRQSLDSVVPDRLFGRIEGLFRDMGWNVVTLKYGRKLEAAFARPEGEQLRRWIDDCPNSLYAALTFQGGAAWRAAILADLGRIPGIRSIIARDSDPAIPVGPGHREFAGFLTKATASASVSLTDFRPPVFSPR
jgi:hypothetical protein